MNRELPAEEEEEEEEWSTQTLNIHLSKSVFELRVYYLM